MRTANNYHFIEPARHQVVVAYDQLITFDIEVRWPFVPFSSIAAINGFVDRPGFKNMDVRTVSTFPIIWSSLT